jgi:Domain of unknown function (DUF4173)
MQKEIFRSEIILLGAALFNIIFWNELLGVNVLLFTLFIVSGLWYIERERFVERPVAITAAMTVLLSLLVIWHNSLIVKVIYSINFAVMVGLIQQREIRFLGSAILLYVANWVTSIYMLLKELQKLPILRGGQKVGQGLKLAVLPSIILPVFYMIYYFANPKFAIVSNQFWGKIIEWLTFDWNFWRILFFIVGLKNVGAIFLKSQWIDVAKFEQDKTDTLVEEDYEDRPFALWNFDENNTLRTAVMLMISLNLLLFLNNMLDFNYVWMGGAEVKTAVELKQYVHEGTYILIVGIIMAIAVLMLLYKGSLNFVKNTPEMLKILRSLGLAWLAQNAVLAISVGMRNWQYIDHYGLAYKRMGVFIFLALVLYGLWLMYLKINEKRTLFFFISRGAWGIYTVLIAACFINWDIFITKYNLTVTTKTNSVDVVFLLKEVSDKNVYLLYENRDRLIEKMPNKPFDEDEYWNSSSPEFANKDTQTAYLDYTLKQKRANFEGKTSGKTWLSWNYPDYRNAQYLK